MAFDFGAALAGIGQLGPGLSDAAEIQRQRQRAATQATEQSTAAQDTHEARQAQTAREQALTSQDTRAANRYTPISSKPEKGEDGKYYMLFLSPDNKIQRLPVEGNYDPNAEKISTLASLGIDPKSDLGKQYLLNIKPTISQPVLKQGPDGNYSWIEKPGAGLPSSTVPSTDSQAPTAAAGGLPSSSPTSPNIVPTGFKGRLPASAIGSTTTSSHVYHWVDNAGKVHETPYTTTSKRIPNGSPASAAPPDSKIVTPSTSHPAAGGRSNPSPAANGLIGNDRVIGTGKLPAGPLKVITTTQPVLDQTQRMIDRIDKLGLANDNTSGYLAKDYLQYKLGKATDPGTLGNDIAALSLSSVVDATSALQGGSRALPALRLAMVHTPNPWIDSPKLLREKLVTIQSRLQDIVNEAKSAGNGAPPQQTIKNFVNSGSPNSNVIVVSPEDMLQ